MPQTIGTRKKGWCRMAARNIRFQIKGGDSRERLRDSLGSLPPQRVYVVFDLELHAEEDVVRIREVMGDQTPVHHCINNVHAYINGITWLDKFGERFEISGIVTLWGTEGKGFKRFFRGEYDTRSRSGMMWVEVDER